MRSSSDRGSHERLGGVVVEYRPSSRARLSVDRPVRSLSQVPEPAHDQDRVHIRLALQDLHCGAWISIREGHLQRLWVVEAISSGNGDGCVELTLAPKLL